MSRLFVSILTLGLMNPVIADKKSDAEVHFFKGTELTESKKYDAAIKSFSAAIKLEPNRSEFWLVRGCAYFFKDNYIQAIGDYDEAIKLSPKNGKLYLLRYYVHLLQGNTATAVNDLMEAYKLGEAEAAIIIRENLVQILKSKMNPNWIQALINAVGTQ